MEVTVAVLGIILSSILLAVVQWVIKRYRTHQTLKRHGIPGPKPNFFDGNLHQLKAEPHPHNIITSWFKKYGDVFGYYVGEDMYVLIKDLELLKKIMIKEFNSFVNRPTIFFGNPVFSHTLVGLKDKRWKEVRNILTPTFSSGKMKQMTDIISRKTDIAVDRITKKAKNHEMFDIYPMMQGLTLDVIAACALAMKTKCQEDPNDDLMQAVKDTSTYRYNKFVEYSIMFPFLKNLSFLFNFISKSETSISYIVNHLKSVVQERQREADFNSIDMLQAMIDNSNINKTGDSGTKLSEDEIVANAFVVFLAGYRTTSTVLGFTIHLLVKYPEIQERLYQEIKKTKDFSYATIQGLQYLDQVCNESLRLYPPASSFVSRLCEQEYDVDKYTIPKGAFVVAPVWDLQHDPDIWPDPWKFDPDRFSPENKGSIHSMAYMPFGNGPRNCIGSRFAQLEAKMVLFKLLQKVRFEACEKTEDTVTLISQNITTCPENGVWVQAVLRSDT